MGFIQKITLVLAGILFSGVVLAAGAPANVASVYANMHDGTLTATWTAVEGAAYYHVYYSHQSILDHGGDYDDGDRTQGKETAYAFTSLPYKSGKIFVAVLAVDGNGVESEGFETEASVDLGSTPSSAPAVSSAMNMASSSSVSASEPIPAVTAVPMAVSNVKAVSATGVLITFTKQLSAGKTFPPFFFMISDGSGVILESGSGVIAGSGTSILVTSALQLTQKQYFLIILQPVPAMDGTNLPTSSARMPFSGFLQAMQSSSMIAVSSSSLSSSSTSSELPYVQNPEITELPMPKIETVAKTKDTKLPKSGIGLFGITALSGMLAGRRLRRRK